jgi:hypothetical protein
MHRERERERERDVGPHNKVQKEVKKRFSTADKNYPNNFKHSKDS